MYVTVNERVRPDNTAVARGSDESAENLADANHGVSR